MNGIAPPCGHEVPRPGDEAVPGMATFLDDGLVGLEDAVRDTVLVNCWMFFVGSDLCISLKLCLFRTSRPSGFHSQASYFEPRIFATSRTSTTLGG